MKKTLGTIVLHLLALSLLAYTASRTFDFLAATLPEAQRILAIAGLAAFDGGLLGWLLYYLNGASTNWQRAISALMVGVSLIGTSAAFIADTLYRAGQAALTTQLSPEATQTIVLALALVITANLAAVVAIHMAEATPLTEALTLRTPSAIPSPNGRETTPTAKKVKEK